MNKSYQNFKKRAGKLAVALTLVGTTVAGGMAIGADGVDAATVKSGYASTAVYLRKSPTTKSARLTTIKKGAKVTILKTSGSWLKVKYNGKTGYVYKTYVKKTFTTKDYSGKFKLKVDLNVRKGPGTSFVKAGTLKKGTVVTVKGKTSNGWYTITYKGSTRYISASSKYLTKYVAPTPKPEKNNAPTISVNDTYTLVKGEDFDYSMLKATASDKEDGDLTSKIDFSGVVNTGKVGKYTVKLTVKDSKGATATKSVEVIVEKAKTNNKPAIAVDSAINGYYEVLQHEDFDYSMLKASAYDEEDGQLKIVYSVNGVVDGKVDTTTLNKKQVVTLKATDSDGNTVTKDIEIRVVENLRPIIECKYNVYKVEQGKEFNLSYLGAVAKDETGSLPIEYKIMDVNTKDYLKSIDTSKAGKYRVIMDATDPFGLKATTKYVIVEVIEDKAPVIKIDNYDNKLIEQYAQKYNLQLDKSTNTIKIEEDENISLAEIKAMFNPTAHAGDETTDITSSINTITSKGFNLNTPGKYTIDFQVTDNKKSDAKTVNVIVEKNIAPKIKFENTEVKESSLADGTQIFDYRINQNVPFNKDTVSKILKPYALDTNQVTGKEDIYSVEANNWYVNTDEDGMYTITLRAKDAKGAETVGKLYVHVIKNTPNQAPVISFAEGTQVKLTESGYVLNLKYKQNLGATRNAQIKALRDMIKDVVTDDKDKNIITDYIIDEDRIDTTLAGHSYTLTIKATDTGDKDGKFVLSDTKVITINILAEE